MSVLCAAVSCPFPAATDLSLKTCAAAAASDSAADCNDVVSAAFLLLSPYVLTLSPRASFCWSSATVLFTEARIAAFISSWALVTPSIAA